jgi:hypothetical protein
VKPGPDQQRVRIGGRQVFASVELGMGAALCDVDQDGLLTLEPTLPRWRVRLLAPVVFAVVRSRTAVLGRCGPCLELMMGRRSERLTVRVCFGLCEGPVRCGRGAID